MLRSLKLLVVSALLSSSPLLAMSLTANEASAECKICGSTQATRCKCAPPAPGTNAFEFCIPTGGGIGGGTCDRSDPPCTLYGTVCIG
jgi:hypothetical protein